MAGRTLTVYLAADTSQFRRQMGHAGDTIDGPDGFRGRVGNLANNLTNMLGPALAGAGIALGAFAVKMGVEGVKAAIDEQAELEKLNGILDGMGFGTAKDSMSAWIDEMARATTFSDSDLRPALGRLIQSTGSLDKAQQLLKIAMDASIGSGKSLDTVTQALAKAANGNTTALERMFPWLKDVDGATGNLDASTDALAQRFSGQAASAAETWSGKLGNAAEAFDELKESFGTGFLEGLSSAEGKTGDLSTALYDLQEPVKQLGTTIGDTLEDIGTYVELFVGAKNALDDFRDSIKNTNWGKAFEGFISALNPLKSQLDAVLAVALRLLEALGAIKAAGNPNITPGGNGQWPGANPNGVGQPGSENAARSVTPTVTYTNVLTQLLAKGDAREGKLAGVLR